MEKLKTRTLYFFSYLIYAICSGLIYFQTNFYIILPLCSTMGIILTAITTIPYQMLAEFHQDKKFRAQGAEGTKRGLGVDCSLLSSIYFLAQSIVAAFMSLITTSLGNYVIVLVSCFFALLGCFWIALFVIFPKSSKTKINEASDTDEKTKLLA
jgi:solute carrier family 45, member 1/2/4